MANFADWRACSVEPMGTMTVTPACTRRANSYQLVSAISTVLFSRRQPGSADAEHEPSAAAPGRAAPSAASASSAPVRRRMACVVFGSRPFAALGDVADSRATRSPPPLRAARVRARSLTASAAMAGWAAVGASLAAGKLPEMSPPLLPEEKLLLLGPPVVFWICVWFWAAVVALFPKHAAAHVLKGPAIKSPSLTKARASARGLLPTRP